MQNKILECKHRETSSSCCIAGRDVAAVAVLIVIVLYANRCRKCSMTHGHSSSAESLIKDLNPTPTNPQETNWSSRAPTPTNVRSKRIARYTTEYQARREGGGREQG